MLGKSLNILGKLFLGTLALVFVYVLGVLLVNLRDKPPSATAMEFQQSWKNRKPVDADDNGYLYLLGFDVESDLDPRTIGVERAQWTKEVIRPAAGEIVKFPQVYNDFQKQLPEKIKELIKLCNEVSTDCINNVNSQSEFINEWSEKDSWAIGRYQELIAHKAWLELADVDMRLPLPNFGDVMKAQRLTFIHAFATMHLDERASVAELLNEDLRFWRTMLKNTDMLIGKMVAVAAIKNNFLWTNQYLLKLKNNTQSDVVLAGLNQPFNDEELSVRRCLIGEWFFIYSAVNLMDVSGTNNAIGKFFIKFAYQKQDASNKSADSLNSMILELDVPLAQFESALEKYQEKRRPEKSLTHYLLHPYNIVGQILGDIAPPSLYTDYVVRTKDLEAFRRGLLLSIEKMEPSSNEMVRHVSPYKTKPFVSNQEQQSVTVFGLGKDARAQQTYYY